MRAGSGKRVNGFESASAPHLCKRCEHLAGVICGFLIPPLWHFPWHPADNFVR